jgi:hypothetical protein
MQAQCVAEAAIDQTWHKRGGEQHTISQQELFEHFSNNIYKLNAEVH